MSIIRLTKRIFASKHKRLLRDIERAYINKQALSLSNGIQLNFTPGHEYDACPAYVYRCQNGKEFVKKFADSIEQVIHIDVCDCFSGDVLVRAVGWDRIFVEIVDVTPCYSCQKAPEPGEKYWVGRCEICSEICPKPEQTSVFSEEDLPF